VEPTISCAAHWPLDRETRLMPKKPKKLSCSAGTETIKSGPSYAIDAVRYHPPALPAVDSLDVPTSAQSFSRPRDFRQLNHIVRADA
jgi:hypothetical protein